jgi:hypothetical protein
MLMPVTLADAVLPAWSAHVPCTDCPAPSAVAVTDNGPLLELPLAAPVAASDDTPDIASVHVNDMPTSPLFHPFAFAAVVLDPPAEGGVASRLIVTEFDDVPPVLVAVHVNVCPGVSVETVMAPQPFEEEIEDSASVTVQLTVTLLVYQPLLPIVPLTFGVITGGVESGGGFTANIVPLPFAICPDEHVPGLLPLQITTVHVPVDPGVKLSLWLDPFATFDTRRSRDGRLVPGTNPGAYHWNR